MNRGESRVIEKRRWALSTMRRRKKKRRPPVNSAGGPVGRCSKSGPASRATLRWLLALWLGVEGSESP